MDTHSEACAGPFIALFGKALCLVKDVRIVPIYENAVHGSAPLFVQYGLLRLPVPGETADLWPTLNPTKLRRQLPRRSVSADGAEIDFDDRLVGSLGEPKNDETDVRESREFAPEGAPGHGAVGGSDER